MRLTTKSFSILLAAAISLLYISTFRTPVEAQSAEQIQDKISARTTDIQNLEKIIQDYQKELNNLSSKGNSLSSKLAELNLTLKKLQANISLTQDKIDNKNLEIQALSKKIGAAQSDISDNRLYVSESLRKLSEESSKSLPQLFIAGDSISDSLNSIDKLAILQTEIETRIDDLKATKTKLESNKTATERAKSDLLKLQSQLNNEKQIVTDTVKEQKKLLAETKSSEYTYQLLLKEKEAQKDAFEVEIYQYESQLKIVIDASKLPKGLNVLAWPLDSVSITQYFGNTPFATANAQIYSGKGHNGIDLRASVGTPVKAALSGTVAGTGNTDLAYGCYSLGKWILVKHPNGLSTLYAHLSLQTTRQGDPVTTGQIIGYSGNTGYSTGPHLHFGVYASSGIEIKRFSASRSCQGAVLPIAAIQAYLNPLSYLPAR